MKIDHKDGRYITGNLHIEEQVYTLVNAYAPNKGNERKLFFSNELQNMIKDKENVIVGGDFNCTLTDQDRIVDNEVIFNEQGRTEIVKVMQECDIEDMYRRRHPDKLVYKFKRGNTRAGPRIDYFNIIRNRFKSDKF